MVLSRLLAIRLRSYCGCKENEPENFNRIRHILLPHDYLNFWLTGKLAAEYGDASGTAFFDVRQRTWSKEVLAQIDGGTGHLLKALPQLLAPEEIVGTPRPEVCSGAWDFRQIALSLPEEATT